MSEFYQPLDPAGAPPAVTPSAGPGSRGTAPYDIQAPSDEAAITAAFNAANALTGAGALYPQGPRQAATEALLNSPAGFSAGGGLSGYDITQGWSGEPDESWANSVQAPGILETPVQGTGDYPGTTQDGLAKYGTS